MSQPLFGSYPNVCMENLRKATQIIGHDKLYVVRISLEFIRCTHYPCVNPLPQLGSTAKDQKGQFQRVGMGPYNIIGGL
jgi:hypothetical protein